MGSGNRTSDGECGGIMIRVNGKLIIKDKYTIPLCSREECEEEWTFVTLTKNECEHLNDGIAVDVFLAPCLKCPLAIRKALQCSAKTSDHLTQR